VRDRLDDAAEAGDAQQEAAKPEASENAAGHASSPNESSGIVGRGAHEQDGAEQAASTRPDASLQHGAHAKPPLSSAAPFSLASAAPFALRDVAPDAVDKGASAPAYRLSFEPGKSESQAAGEKGGAGPARFALNSFQLLGKSADGCEGLTPADDMGIKAGVAGGAPTERGDAKAEGGIKMEGAAAGSKDVKMEEAGEEQAGGIKSEDAPEVNSTPFIVNPQPSILNPTP